MNTSRIYSASFNATVLGTAAQSIIEVQVPAASIITVYRAWLGATIGATPADEVIEIEFYGNDAAATGGTAMTEQPLTRAAAADPSNCTALLEPTIGATPLGLLRDSFHLQNGWLYLPIPEERVTIFGASADPGDNVGIRLVSASAATWSGTGGIIWAEASAT